MTAVDWRRVAEPQEDGYDIIATLQAVTQSRYASFARTRPMPADRSLVWPEGRTRFVKLADNVAPDSTLRDMPPDHINVKQGLRLLDTWPIIRPLCRQVLIGLAPLTMGVPGGSGSHGCCCGNFGDDFGWIYVTADSPSGFAEGIVHEMGHWKLRALGIWFEDWTDTLLLNSPSELYTSPVRKDIERPMGAVLHAQYSYIHVAAICVAILKATLQPTKDDVDWTALQLRRIEEGQHTVRSYAHGTPEAGVPFLEGLDDWTTRVLKEGWEALGPIGGTA